MTRNSNRKRNTRRWCVADLHIHTPASSDYQEPEASYLDILQRAEQRGLDMIAFTDHNTVAGVRRMREEISELELLERLGRMVPEEKARLDEYRRLLNKIVVLPGFEFTATFGFHILGVFPPWTAVRDLEHVLLTLNVPKDQLDTGSATVGATADVLTAYKTIAEAGGLAIAAHVNSSNGVAMRGMNFGGQTRIAYTQDPNLAALEVTDLDQKGRRSTAGFFNGTKPEYPRRMHCIQGSDAHRLKRDPDNAKNLGIGDRATELLVDEVSFDALKAVFIGRDFARTRPHSALATPDSFDYVQQAREEGPNLIQDFHEGMTARGGKLFAVLADLCAFANSNGGTLYLGANRNPRILPLGMNNPAQASTDLNDHINRLITPRLDCTIDTQESKGRMVIRVLVPRGEDAPYALDDNKIYIRREGETMLAHRDDIVRLVLSRREVISAPPPSPLSRLPAPPPPLPLGPAPVLEPIMAESPEVSPPVMQNRPPAPFDPPRTGVEIVASETRDGRTFHTMLDLRNGSVVKNVTRASARKLWHYAITERENNTYDASKVEWEGDLGLIKKWQRAGVTRYDLAQSLNGETRIYYGVTEDGIHGEWKNVIDVDED